MSNVRPHVNSLLPPTIANAVGNLPRDLAAIGFLPSSWEEPGSFGNLQVTFTNGQRQITVVRDRGQFHVVGERGSLEPAQLWRSFNGAQSLSTPLVEWLRVGTET